MKDKERFGRARKSKMNSLRAKYGEDVANRALWRVNRRKSEGYFNNNLSLVSAKSGIPAVSILADPAAEILAYATAYNAISMEKSDLVHSKIKVIYLGVNDIYFSPKKTKKIINHKYFFSLTTHPKRKNVYRILEVFTDNKNLSDYKYVIAGLIENKQLL